MLAKLLVPALCLMALCLMALCLMALPANAVSETLPVREADPEWFYQNPIGLKGIADPSVLVTDDARYVYGTTTVGYMIMGYRLNERFNDYERLSFAALPTMSWALKGYWAPEVIAYEDGYAMVLSAYSTVLNGYRIAVARADTPEGPFIDIIGGPLFDFGYNVIDAGLFIDEGRVYLLYVRDVSDNVVGDHKESWIYGVEMEKDLKTMIGEPVLLCTPTPGWETVRKPSHWWNEGPRMVRHGDQYYLYYSANDWQTKNYGVGCAVSDAPLGTFVKSDLNPLMEYIEKDGDVLVGGSGHDCMFTVGEEMFSGYHTLVTPNNPAVSNNNRRFSFDRMGWHADGTPFISGPTQAKQIVPLSAIGRTNAALTASVASDANAKQTACLNDGDVLPKPAYQWRGSKLTMTFDPPVMSDMIILYPAREDDAIGEMTINGTYTAALDLSRAGTLSGANLPVAFDMTEISEITIAFDRKARLGEVMVIAPAQ